MSHPGGISVARLGSPRLTTTNPTVSKDEFTHILETSPYVRKKFVHALALRMIPAKEVKRRAQSHHHSVGSSPKDFKLGL
jgi:hypothetical protein